MLKKKFAILAFGFVIGMSSLAGCNTGNSEKASQNNNQNTSQNSNSSKQNSNSSKEVVLKHLGPYDKFNFNTDPTVKLLEELTGYKVDYSNLPAEQANEKLNLEIAGEAQYTTIKLRREQFDILNGKGVLLELNSYLDSDGPNVKEAIGQVSWDVVTSNGKILGIPEKNSSDNVNNGIFVRKDILDKHGLSMPVTTEDFKNVCLALKAKGVNAPASFDPKNLHSIFGAFGMANEWNEVNGELVYRGNDERIKEYLDYMKDLYSTGCLGSDWEVINAETAQERFINGDSVFMFGAWWSGKAIYDALKAQGIANATEVVEVIPSLVGPSGTKGTFRDRAVNYITAIPKYMEKTAPDAIKWVNSKLDKDNFLKFTLGEEGYHYTVENNSYFPVLDLNSEGVAKFDEKNNSAWYLTGTREADYALYWQARARKTPENFITWTKLNDRADEFGAYNPLGFAPNIESLSSNTQALAAIVSDFSMQYIVGKNTDFNSYTNQLKSNNIDQVTKDINAWYATTK